MDATATTLIAAGSVVVAGVAGYFIGHEVGEPEPGSVQHGTVFSVDRNEICIELDNRAMVKVYEDEVECYRAAGQGVKVGQEVSFVASKELLDPEDTDGGKVLTLVYLQE